MKLLTMLISSNNSHLKCIEKLSEMVVREDDGDNFEDLAKFR